MRDYLLNVIGAVILSAIMVAVFPNGKTSGIMKALSRLVCILAIVSPVLQFFRSGTFAWEEGENSTGIFTQTVIESENAFIEYYSEMRVRETERRLEAELLEKYEIEAKVSLTYEYEEELVKELYTEKKIKITEIYVAPTQPVDEEVLKRMWEYLTKNYCSEVLIE